MHLFEEHINKSWCDYDVVDEVQHVTFKYTQNKHLNIQRWGVATYITLSNTKNIPHNITFCLTQSKTNIKDYTGDSVVHLYLFDHVDDFNLDTEYNMLKYLTTRNQIGQAPEDSTHFRGIRIEIDKKNPKVLFSLGKYFGLDVLKSFILIFASEIHKFLSGDVRINSGSGYENAYLIYDVEKNFSRPDIFVKNLLLYSQKHSRNIQHALDVIKKKFPQYLEDVETLDAMDDESELF